jgi:hypothetical protein
MAFLDTIKKVAVGSEEKTGAMLFKTAAPLDDRFSVKKKAGLICKEVFGVKDGDEYTDSKLWIFQGLSTTVQDTGDTYVLSDLEHLPLYSADYLEGKSSDWLDAEIAKGWTRLAKASELENISITGLSNVFNWRGIAQGITPD